MENQYTITFKKYREYCKKNKIALPSWVKLDHFQHVIELMKSGHKLQACKYLCDQSTENGTRDMFGLKWTKKDFCDVIDMYKTTSNEVASVKLVKPVTPPNLLHIDEVREVLAPFKALADEVLNNPNLDRNQTIYAYNRAQITLADLRRVVEIIEKIDSPLPANWFNNH
jgi:hypothetical protein